MRKFTFLFPYIGEWFSHTDFCHLKGNYYEINLEIQKSYQFTYTSFGEDRKQLWSDTYLKDWPEVYHLGVDIQVPSSTKVHLPFPGLVVNKITDFSELGWGGRIDILDGNGRYWIFGHLNHFWTTGNKFIDIGGEIGEIGDSSNNGQVFEHLHVQVCDFSKILSGEIDIESVDGYGSKSELENWLNPLDLL